MSYFSKTKKNTSAHRKFLMCENNPFRRNEVIAHNNRNVWTKQERKKCCA